MSNVDQKTLRRLRRAILGICVGITMNFRFLTFVFTFVFKRERLKKP